MPWPFTSVDSLCEDITKIIEQDDQSVRKAFADQAFGSMLVWEILVGGTIHICGHLAAEEIREKLQDCLDRLKRKDETAIADARATVEHPKLEIQHVSRLAKDAAIGSVASILKDMGHPEKISTEHARSVTLIIEHYASRD